MKRITLIIIIAIIILVAYNLPYPVYKISPFLISLVLSLAISTSIVLLLLNIWPWEIKLAIKKTAHLHNLWTVNILVFIFSVVISVIVFYNNYVSLESSKLSGHLVETSAEIIDKRIETNYRRFSAHEYQVITVKYKVDGKLYKSELSQPYTGSDLEHSSQGTLAEKPFPNVGEMIEIYYSQQTPTLIKRK